MAETGPGIQTSKPSILERSAKIEKFRGVAEYAGFVLGEGAVKYVRDPELRREDAINNSRRKHLQNIFVDRMYPPMTRQEIEAATRTKVQMLERCLQPGEAASFDTRGHGAVVLQRSSEHIFRAAHFNNGRLEMLAQIDLSPDTIQPTRMVFTNTHEGRIESAREEGYELTRTAVNTFNFFVEGVRGKRRELPQRRGIPSAVMLAEMERESVNPTRPLLREEQFEKINAEAGEPLKDGHTLVIVDTTRGSPVSSVSDIRFRTKEGWWHPRKGEIDDFMEELLFRGDETLAREIRAIGQTSRGNSNLASAREAATIGVRPALPVFPGYNPYLQHRERENGRLTGPKRVSPTSLAILELGKAQMAGRTVRLVDEGPTTDRNYYTAFELAKERGIDLTQIPVIFMVGVDIKADGTAELIEKKGLNYNYGLGYDCRRGFQLALEKFQDVTLFSPDVAACVGIPITEFEEFVKFTKQTGNPEYQRLAEDFLLRAEDFNAQRRTINAESLKTRGKPLLMPHGSFAAQDTLIGAYLAHPEWFVVKEMPLTYKSFYDKRERKKESVKVIVDMTEEGKKRISPLALESNQGEF